MDLRDVKHIRLILGMTQDELSDAIGITQPTLCKIEYGQGMKTFIKNRDKIQQAFHEKREEKVAELKNQIDFLYRLF